MESDRGRSSARLVRELKELASLLGVAAQISVEKVLVGAQTGILSRVSAFASASHAEDFVPPLACMDDLFSKYHIDWVDFLKIDIEGSEFDLFREAPEWLSKVNRIAMEVHPKFGLASDLQEKLESYGISVELRNNNLGPVSAISTAGGYLFATRRFH
jgi:FkbM family methyltransferase